MDSNSSIRKQLFVTGVARSGTTALARLLNTHPEVVVGIERYKYLFMKASRNEHPTAYFSGLFTRERFFDYRPEDTNLSLESRAALYDGMREKFDSATYVGDKVPGLYRRFDLLSQHFPHCKVAWILREPAPTALSWQRRAENPADQWHKRNGFKRAIQEWNLSLRLALQAAPLFGDDLVFVSYGRIFGAAGPTVISNLRKALQLSQPWPNSSLRFLERSRARVSLPLTLEHLHRADDSADLVRYQAVLSRTL